MKSFTFFLILISMLGISAVIVAKKMGVDFGLDGSLPSLNLGSIGSGEAVDVSRWEQVLPGRWEFKTKFTQPRDIWIFEGEVVYLPDGSFTRQMTVKFYHDNYREPKMDDDDLGIIAGGTVKGKWKVDTLSRCWRETVSTCNLQNSVVSNGFNKEYSACEWFPLGKGSVFGNSVSDLGSSKFEEFSADEISISGKDFDSGGKKTWSFRKIEE